MAVKQAQAALAGLKGSITSLQTTLGGVNTASAAMSAVQMKAAKNAGTLASRLTASGKAAMMAASKFQWYSRQLMYNVGLPLLLVGGYAGKWAMETEAAMVKVSKVYGDLDMNTSQKKRELDALAGYFEAVSNRYGILQKDVIAIGADWAAAGAKAVGLAKATKLTVETMILGEMTAEEATKSLIAIQEAWRLNAVQLTQAIGDMNLVENQTAITMQGLIEGFIRTGSAARIAGLSIGDTASLMAALVPAAGSATVAGNSLKTILSRMAAPTRQAKNAFKEMGIDIKSAGWQALSARAQMEKLSQAFERNAKTGKLRSKAAQQALATDIAGRQQYNRFIQLMDALSDRNSAYWTAQDALTKGKEKLNGETFRQIQYERELNQVLQSNPGQMKIVLAQMQNMLIKGVAPLIPYFIAFLGYMKQIFTWLGNIPPQVKNLVAGLVLMSLAITLVTKLISPFILLGGLFARIIPIIVEIGTLAFTALATPWGLAIAAIIGAVLVLVNFFPDAWFSIVLSVRQMWQSFIGFMSDSTNVFGKIMQALISMWFALPTSVRTAIQAVVDIVYQGAMAVYSLFSYLNPFAHHSPSLVENVTKGMAVIMQQFEKITGISNPIDKAYADIKRFKDLMASFRNGKAVDLEWADKLKAIKAINPAALTSAKALIADLKVLMKILDGLQVELDAQQRIVDEWSVKLDAANAALKEQEDILTSLSDEVDYYQGLINDANDSMQKYASASIIGMQDLNDQVQLNTEEQNKLKLAMAQMESASGGFDTIAAKMAALNGEFETLSSKRDELQKLGAGSDILGYYDQQIDAIRTQKDSIYDTVDAYTAMGQQLSDLEKQANILDLTKAVQFDPLTYQIDKLANTQKELSYEEIVAGITNAKGAIDDYTPALEEATAAMKEQEAVVYSLTQERNAIQKSYDIEAAKLDVIKAKYDRVKDAIDAITAALNEMSTAAGKNGSSISGAVGAAGGGYPGGTGIKKPSTGIKNLEAGTAEMVNELTRKLQGIADQLDFTKPIREAWNNAVTWWTTNIQPGLDAIKGILLSWFVKTGIQIQQWWKPVGDFLGNLFGDDFETAWKEFSAGVGDFVDNVGPGLKDFWDSIQPGLRGFAELLKYVLMYVGALFAILIKTFLWLWNGAIRPLLGALGSFIGYFFDFLASVGKVGTAIYEIFTANPDAMDHLREAFGMMINSIGGMLWSLVKGVLAIVLNLLIGIATETWKMVQGFFPDLARNISAWFAGLMQIPWVSDFVNSIAGAFAWLYDILLGHSIIPDIVNGVTGWFKALIGMAAAPIATVVNGISGAFTWLKGVLDRTGIPAAAEGIVNGIKDAWNNSDLGKTIANAFKPGTTGVTTSLTGIETSSTTTVSNVNDIFNSPTWQGMGSTISDPFTTGATNSQTSFDNIYNGFNDLGTDIFKNTKTNWPKITKQIKETWKDLPKDQRKANAKLLKGFIKVAKDIQKQNPALWSEIVKGMTTPMAGAATDIDGYAGDIQDSIDGLSGTTIPFDWKNLGTGLTAPTKSAAKNTKDNVKSMKDSIAGLTGAVPSGWKNLDSSIIDPVIKAKNALSKIKFSVSGLTGPLGKISSAADKVTKALSKMVSAWKTAKGALGLKGGGSADQQINNFISTIPTNATGGKITGPGGPRDDKILSWLSNGEHVFTSREVSKLGGQSAVYALRSFINKNNVNAYDLMKMYGASAPRRANGGSPINMGVSTSSVIASSLRRMESATVSRGSSSETKIVRIEHATFEFPNVKNGADAKDFLDNLEQLL